AGRLLVGSAGPVGPEIAVARPARASGAQLRDRPAVAQPGRDARLLKADGIADPARARVFALVRSRSPRSDAGPQAPGRGRIPERVRWRRLLRVAALLLDGRGARRLHAGR